MPLHQRPASASASASAAAEVGCDALSLLEPDVISVQRDAIGRYGDGAVRYGMGRAGRDMHRILEHKGLDNNYLCRLRHMIPGLSAVSSAARRGCAWPQQALSSQ